jgi:hypothetical protein
MQHAPNWNGAGFTLCGLALEAGEDGEVTGEREDPKIATVGQRVTCPECQRAILHVQTLFRPRGFIVQNS